MKLTVVTIEPPFPPLHGGRVDVWRRLQAFASHGVKLQLIYWYGKDLPTGAELDEMRSLCDSVVGFPIKRGVSGRFKGILKLPFQSIYLTGRELSKDENAELTKSVRDFSSDAIWADSIFGAKLAIELANLTGRPIFYRSQNIEFQYRQKQYERAIGLRGKAMAWMSKSSLGSFESMVFHRAETVFDISMDDLKYWKRHGVQDIQWLPPFIDDGLVDELQRSKSSPAFDIVYLGNLYTPNNIEGILWFVENVFSILRKKADITFLLAGSNPHPVIERLGERPGIKLLPNVKSVTEVYQQGKVLINPIFSGSGVNVKSVEMLFSGKPVITTKQGVAGLPESVRSCFRLAANADEFADLCLSALTAGENNGCGSAELSEFKPAAISKVIEHIRSRL